MVTSVPVLLDDAVERLAVEWDADGRMARLWAGDASLWTGAGEGEWLGWLEVVGAQRARVGELRALQREVVEQGFEHAVLLGMGGSSLCPEVLRRSFGRVAGAPDLRVLDSTDPAQVVSIEQRIDYERTLFIVSSKSGTTLEPNIFLNYFAERARGRAGPGGSRFVAVTDPRLAARGAGRPRGVPARVPWCSEHRGGAIPRCPTSGWSPRPSWGSTSAGCWSAPRRCGRPACRRDRCGRIPAPCWG